MNSSGAGSSAADNIYFPGTVSLLQDLDKKLMVLLRDGRVLIGILRSIDQFANLVLHRTIERIHVGKKYGDIPRGKQYATSFKFNLSSGASRNGEKNLFKLMGACEF